MKPARWQQIERLYNQALEIEAKERSAFLRESCAGDDDLRRDLEQLLAEEPQTFDFLEKPALREIAREFAATEKRSWLGRQIGNYQFLSLIGAGGMGEVYRARDTELKRDVAIKVLPDAFSRDPGRVARFQREAELLASLNHPNIAGIYALEEANGSRLLVLELIEGETLDQRINRGALPIEEALAIARTLCDALEAAHEKGVVHRDLKPANLKITRDGTVKVLDFGLAKAFSMDEHLDVSNPRPADTVHGLVMGTPAYMSPEQAKGRRAGRSSDVWSFGTILYEMLTGRAVFDGETSGEILARVLEAEPHWHRLPAGTPDNVRRLLRRCLEKDEKRRLRDMRDARLEIEDAESPQQTDGTLALRAHKRKERVLLSVAALLALVTAVLGMFAFRPSPPAPEMRSEINTPPTTRPESLAISPDGQKIIFAAAHQGQPCLWLRSLDGTLNGPLQGTENAFTPFWSADGRSIGFFADGQLKLIDIDGGSARTLTYVPADFLGGTWNSDGVILFATHNSPILRIDATGGEPTAVTRVETPLQNNHRVPHFLPDGRNFLYYVRGAPEVQGVYIGQLDRPETRRLLDANSGAVFTSGHLLFVREGTLWAQSFDSKRLEMAGSPFPVAENVAVQFKTDIAAVAAAAAGPIVYRTGSADVLRQFTWVHRSSQKLGTVGELIGGAADGPSLSPDGRRVAFDRQMNRNTDIWLLEVARGVPTRLTFDMAPERAPVWSPNGEHIVFSSNRKGVSDLYLARTSNPGDEKLLVASSQQKMALDWSTDGRYLLYRSRDARGHDIWVKPMEGDGKEFPIIRTSFDERDGQFSPDGKWIAYQSNQSGRDEIYVQAFDGLEGQVKEPTPISTKGGVQARWARDGKELFYISLDGRLMAVPMRFPVTAQTVEPGEPIPLFATRVGRALQTISRQQYVVARDGRFLINNEIEEATLPLTVILNWRAKRFQAFGNTP
jgi:serine/threonine protein kinase/Tol biopolymer transport system component